MNDYCVGLPSLQRPGLPFWSIVPYFIPQRIYITYLSAIETFLQLYVNSMMYLHGFVSFPMPVTVAVRQSIYEMFLANIPWAVFRLVESLRFRFYFRYNPFETSIQISQMNVLPLGESAWCESDLPH